MDQVSVLLDVQRRVTKLELIPFVNGSSHPTGFGLHVILQVKSGATVIFPPTTAGLVAALAASISGNVIYIPPFSIAGDITIPAGIKLMGLSRYESVLAGKVTGTDSSALENLTVSVSVSDGSAHSAIVGTGSGTFHIHDCEVICIQAGAGAAYGVDVNGGLSAQCIGCAIHAESAGGAGYGVRGQTGDITVRHSSVYGSTEPYLQ